MAVQNIQKAIWEDKWLENMSSVNKNININQYIDDLKQDCSNSIVNALE